MNVQEFTLEQGLKIQADQLKKWRKIMKSEFYAKLDNYINLSNQTAKTGSDVFRGVDIDNWVYNNLMKD